MGEIASGKAQQLAPATPPDPVLVLAAWALPLSETIGFSCGLPLAVRKQNSQHWNTGQHGTLLTFKHDIPLQNSLAREKKHTFVWTERTRQFPDASSCSVLFTGFYR